MEKNKKIEVADLHLPEAIIQHIQSFLNGKEAARTTILSKSWYNAWLTRPNLDFDQKVFDSESNSYSAKKFWRFVSNTVERYEKLKLQIDSFTLWIHAKHSLVNKLIIKALKMGATCLDFKIYRQKSDFALSHQVFWFENLTKLSVSGCKISVGRISCRRLKSLALDGVFVENDTVWEIMSSCPLIENFSLSNTLDRVGLTEFGKKNVVDGPIFLNEFRKLEVLSLHGVKFPPSYFDDFSSKFPCLKVLALNRCQPYKEISISSPSLECIDLNFIMYDIMLKLTFDVPSIRKFTFSGSKVPSVSIKTTQSYWTSFIKIQRRSPPSRPWFFELNKLLMSLSKVLLLNLVILSQKASEEGEFRGVCRPEVQLLNIIGPCSACPVLYYSLFQCCRPSYVTQIWYENKSYKPTKRRHDFVEFVGKRTAQQVGFNSCVAYQRMMAGECDLEEVHAEFYDESASKWRRRPRVLDPGDGEERRIRLHLKWRQVIQQV